MVLNFTQIETHCSRSRNVQLPVPLFEVFLKYIHIHVDLYIHALAIMFKVKALMLGLSLVICLFFFMFALALCHALCFSSYYNSHPLLIKFVCLSMYKPFLLCLSILFLSFYSFQTSKPHSFGPGRDLFTTF